MNSSSSSTKGVAESAIFRPNQDWPTVSQILARVAVVAVVTGASLLLLAWLFPGLDIDRPRDALFAGLVIGLVNGVVWPALSFVVVPVSVLTLGVGAVVLDVFAVVVLLEMLPGVTLDGLWTGAMTAVGLAAVTTLVSSILAVDDTAWLDQQMARRASRRRDRAVVTDVPGVVFVQLDGVSIDVLRRAFRSGDVPTLHRWVRDGSHHLTGWITGWSSQTGVSQCGILHGSTVDMPAFRWLDKSTGELVVSNRPASAAGIERRHSDGCGLLAHHGSSYSNLFTGDAERAVMTMSVVAKKKEGRIGSGYVRYFSRPDQAVRTLQAVVVDIARERTAARQQRRRGVEPRVHRGATYALLRAFTTVVSRDVSVNGVLNDVAEGRAAIYVDFLGYDEVSHHSGPERADALAVLRDLDRQIARIERSFRWAPRPYRLVVLSDHGQTQGSTFRERAGEGITELVARLCGTVTVGDPDSDAGRTESTAWFLRARQHEPRPVQPAAPAAAPTVLASGSLGLVYFPDLPRRMTREEIDARYPGVIDRLVDHPDVGFVLVATESEGSVVLSRDGRRNLHTGEVTGDDPLAPFGEHAVGQVAEVDAYTTVADLMLNARYDPELEEVAAFEEQVGSHGGIGGPQTRPFILHPADLTTPAEPMLGSPAVHRVLKSWLAELGQPVSLPWLDVEAGRRGA
jgi:uncharacterized membrane protein YvlD (DUF360 family)